MGTLAILEVAAVLSEIAQQAPQREHLEVEVDRPGSIFGPFLSLQRREQSLLWRIFPLELEDLREDLAVRASHRHEAA